MQQTCTILALFLSLGLSAQSVATFEEIEVDSFLNGSDGSGGFESANLFLPNTYTLFDGFESWSGWSISSITDTVTTAFSNQYSAKSGSGFDGSANYAVAFGETNSIYLDETATLDGFYITNTTVTYEIMENGNLFSKRFGGESGDDPDFFRLTIKKYLNGELSQDSVDFYLADYRFEDNSQDYIVNDWEWVDLSSLGRADSLEFTMLSTDVGEFGINTPLYFCMDNFTSQTITSTKQVPAFALKVYPNPTTEAVFVERQAQTEAILQLYDQQGRLLHSKITRDLTSRIGMQNLPAGQYFLTVQTAEGRVVQAVVKR